MQSICVSVARCSFGHRLLEVCYGRSCTPTKSQIPTPFKGLSVWDSGQHKLCNMLYSTSMYFPFKELLEDT
jgi:hypothetical protein